MVKFAGSFHTDMGVGKAYRINFAGLDADTHHFEFKVSDDVFAGNNCIDLACDSLHLSIGFNKQAGFADCSFHFSGGVFTLCDRCNGSLSLPLNFNRRLVFKFAEEAQEISDEIVAVRESDGFIDLSQYIYEFIVLALPVRKLHKTGECDPCIIEALERKHSNEETLKSPDPRWQALQQIRN